MLVGFSYLHLYNVRLKYTYMHISKHNHTNTGENTTLIDIIIHPTHQLVVPRALRGSSKMFGASGSNIERSFGSDFFAFFFTFFFSSVSPARQTNECPLQHSDILSSTNHPQNAHTSIQQLAGV